MIAAARSCCDACREAVEMFAGRWIRFAAAVLSLATAAPFLTGCGKTSAAPAAPTASTVLSESVASITSAPVAAARAAPQPQDPLVVLHTSAGDLKLKLFADKSPQ